MSDPATTLAVDLGGTQMRAALVHGNGDVVYLTVSTGVRAGVLLDGRLVDPIRDALERHGPQELPDPIEVVVAGLGDDAALAGAAAWDRAARRTTMVDGTLHPDQRPEAS